MPNENYENPEFEKQIKRDVKDLRKMLYDKRGDMILPEMDKTGLDKMTKKERDAAYDKHHDDFGVDYKQWYERVNDDMRRTLWAKAEELRSKLDSYVLETGYMSREMGKIRDELLGISGNLGDGTADYVKLTSAGKEMRYSREDEDQDKVWREQAPEITKIANALLATKEFPSNYFNVAQDYYEDVGYGWAIRPVHDGEIKTGFRDHAPYVRVYVETLKGKPVFVASLMEHVVGRKGVDTVYGGFGGLIVIDQKDLKGSAVKIIDQFFEGEFDREIAKKQERSSTEWSKLSDKEKKEEQNKLWRVKKLTEIIKPILKSRQYGITMEHFSEADQAYVGHSSDAEHHYKDTSEPYARIIMEGDPREKNQRGGEFFVEVVGVRERVVLKGGVGSDQTYIVFDEEDPADCIKKMKKWIH